MLVSVISAFFSINGTHVVAKESIQPADQLAIQLPFKQDSRLEEVAKSNHVWNGVTVTHNGRLFVTLTQSEGAGMQVAEIDKNGALQAYPDASWNQWQPGADHSNTFCMSMRHV